MIQQSLQPAYRLYQAGRLEETEKVCKQIIAAEHSCVEALHLLAMIAAQTGREEEAIDLSRRAIAVAPNIPNLHSTLGAIYQRRGNLDEAIACCRKAIALQPDFVEAHFNLGVALDSKEQFDDAIASFRRVLELAPNHGQALCNLGSILQRMDRWDEAVECFQRAIAINPNDLLALSNLGGLLVDKGQLDAAMPYLERARAIGPNFAHLEFNFGNLWRKRKQPLRAIACYEKAVALKSGYVEAYHNMAAALNDLGRTDEAIARCRQALELKPDCVEALNNMGAALFAADQPSQAMECFDQALALNPRSAAALCNLGCGFHLAKQIDRAIDCFLQSIAINPNYSEAHLNLGNSLKDVGRLEESLASSRKAISIDPGNVVAHSNFVFSMLYHPNCTPRDIFIESRNWNDRHAEPLSRYIRPHHNDRDPDRRLRIGYVSPDYRAHVVMQCFLPLVSNHDHEQVEIFCYANVPRPDATTEILRGHADAWRDIVGVSDEEVADSIRQDRIDILVDLAGHTAGNRLLVFAHKPAPIQITYQGYPATSGMTAMTHRMTDPLVDPVGMTEAFHSEELIWLPRVGWSWCDPGDAPGVVPPPVLSRGHVTFGSFNNFAKINPPLLKLWAEILHAVPQSRLQINGSSASCESVRRGVLETMRSLGIESHRVDLRPPAPSGEYYPRYNQTDIALDSYPYHGTTTTFDTLWMSVPMVTLAGPSHVSRVGVSLLTQVGLPELVAQTSADYVRIAAELAGDLPRMTEIRRSLRQRMRASPLMDAPGFARDVESAYRAVWREWCKRPFTISPT